MAKMSVTIPAARKAVLHSDAHRYPNASTQECPTDFAAYPELKINNAIHVSVQGTT